MVIPSPSFSSPSIRDTSATRQNMQLNKCTRITIVAWLIFSQVRELLGLLNINVSTIWKDLHPVQQRNPRQGGSVDCGPKAPCTYLYVPEARATLIPSHLSFKRSPHPHQYISPSLATTHFPACSSTRHQQRRANTCHRHTLPPPSSCYQPKLPGRSLL